MNADGRIAAGRPTSARNFAAVPSPLWRFRDRPIEQPTEQPTRIPARRQPQDRQSLWGSRSGRRASRQVDQVIEQQAYGGCDETADEAQAGDRPQDRECSRIDGPVGGAAALTGLFAVVVSDLLAGARWSSENVPGPPARLVTAYTFPLPPAASSVYRLYLSDNLPTIPGGLSLTERHRRGRQIAGMQSPSSRVTRKEESLMAEFLLFVCRRCGKPARVPLEPGDGEQWETRGSRLCADCLSGLFESARGIRARPGATGCRG